MDVVHLRDHPWLGIFDWMLRGIGQVVFQNNALSGAVILFALFYNSWIYGSIAILGVAASTLAALALKADREMIKAGLFGFNGALVALCLVAFTSADFRTGAVPAPLMTVYIIFGSALSTIVMQAMATVLAPFRVAALTGPFVLVGWMFLFAVLKFENLDAGPLVKPISPEDFPDSIAYTLPTWYMGIGNAIGQIFFQDNWITGYLIILGIAINSRISAAMALIGAGVAALTAVISGGPEGAIRDGLFGYNAALTAMALCGVFLVANVQSVLYAIFGAIISTWLWASVAIFLGPIAMPVLTSAFVLVTWMMLLAQSGFKALSAMPPPDAPPPSDS
ncbi:urea transporter [Tateyamaria pelophila]|uniref:urea transporter n=1 Tax=Tateyamaria pelophila TaxID=328415 RepID=UPI001CBAB2B9|nr:urea transporter [Tateyamaria pelophila]